MQVTLYANETPIAVCQYKDISKQIEIYKLAGYENISVSEVELAEARQQYSRELLRNKIYAKIELESLLGTTADTAQILVLLACADAVALNTASTFAAYKQARMEALVQLSGSTEEAGELVNKAAQLLADVQAGQVLMPFLVKPGKAAGVFDDVAKRATAVAQVLVAAQN